MRPVRVGNVYPTPWRSVGTESRARTESGFTLIELIIVSLVLPVVLGGIAFALVAIFSLQTGVASRISGSGDAQVVSSNFETDIQGASMIIAPAAGAGAPAGQSPAACGSSGTEVLSLEPGTANTVISYMEVQQASSTTYDLVRNVCTNGTLSSSTTVSSNVASGLSASVTCSATLTSAQALVVGLNALSVSELPAPVNNGDTITLGTGTSAPTVTASGTANSTYSLNVNATSAISTLSVGTPVTDSSWATNNCGAGGTHPTWINTTSVTDVTIAVNEPATGSGTSAYNYGLAASPRGSTPANAQTSVATPTATTCGFASANTGTYASSLCFVDFSSFNATAAASPNCELMAASIPNTSYTINFCISVSGAPVEAHDFPTWTNAFLGNTLVTGQPFYTGVPGNPAIYQTAAGTTTVTVSDVKVTNGNGTPATGWSLVTGDAETTDASESITWTSDQPFSLLWNSPGDPVGLNVASPVEYGACSAPTSPDGLTPQSLLTGGTSLTVECQSTVSASNPRTGTVMLEAPAPSTLTDTLVGSGLEGIFIGLLVPS
jgi:prepilin-type N-terminal cleavage/methylation domain-containing protein